MKNVRVAIVDDSVMFRTFLERSLNGNEEIDVVGVFGDPLEAIEQIPRIKPDVIAVDMEMPKMRGNDFLRKILPANPGLRAIVISSLGDNVFDAMQAGAIDFVGKPGSQPGYTNMNFVRDITETIKVAATATSRPSPMPVRRPAAAAPTPAPTAPRAASLTRVTSKSLIAIGASTGGTEAILEVLRQLPANAPGVVIVQHMPPGFTDMYSQRVDKICAMTVREAKHRDRVKQGTVLIAPGGDMHMRVDWESGGYVVNLQTGAKVNGHCPSVDVLFESVAKAAGQHAVGVILTGMGGDGAKNLLKIRQAGAHTIGQDESTCVVYGMPKVAYDLGAVAEQLPIGAIGNAILRRFT